MQHDTQWTLQWDSTQAYSYEGKTKTRIYNDEKTLREWYEHKLKDPQVSNVRMFKIVTTIERIDIVP